jgi:hypothetical protein
VIRRIFAIASIVVSVGVVASLPPRALPVTGNPAAPPVARGVMHVHTTQSDGSGPPDAVAAAARRAGLSFVVLTDHGDGTRNPAAPRYSSGVLVIDAVEISTEAGHVVALGLPRAPYPLRGEPEDVLEDVRRLGGMSIVAHPTSGKVDLQWHERGQIYDGIEWLNGDSEWRDERPLTLARILASYWFRPPESLALLLDRPVEALALWDRVSAGRSVVGLAGSDAHAKIGGDLDHGGPAALNLPSYEQSFRTFSIGLPGLTLSGNAVDDARAVVAAIRAGHVFTAVDALARPGRIGLVARAGGRRAEAGDRMPAGGAVSIHVEVDAPPTMPLLRLYRNADVVSSTTGIALDYMADGTPAVYRAEATLQPPGGHDSGRVPWLVSNPIYVGPATVAPSATLTTTRTRSLKGVPWTVEHSDRANGQVQAVRALGGTQTYMRYALGGARSEGPFVAFATPLSGTDGHTRLLLQGRASQPMRVSLQLRTGAGQGSARWRRSIYLDEGGRAMTLDLTSFKAVEEGQPATVPLDAVTSLLFVVDSVNTALGTSGEIWIDGLTLAR